MLRWARRAKDRLLVLHVKDLAQDVIEYALLGALIGLLVVAVILVLKLGLGGGSPAK